VAETLTFAQHLNGTGLRDCFDFWLSRRQGDRPPAKRAINPSALPRAIIADLFLYELTADERFNCRLAGTAIRRAFGKEPTGLYLDEIVNPASVAARTALFRATLEKELPVVYGGTLAEGDKLWMPFKRLLLPVADDIGASRFVFGMVIFPRLTSFDKIGSAEELTLEFEAWASAADLLARVSS
jgi:hypothetical protein